MSQGVQVGGTLIAGTTTTNVISGLTFENNLVVKNAFGIRADPFFNAANAIVAFNDVRGNFQSNWVNYTFGYGAAVTTNLNETTADAKMNFCEDPMFL